MVGACDGRGPEVEGRVRGPTLQRRAGGCPCTMGRVETAWNGLQRGDARRSSGLRRGFPLAEPTRKGNEVRDAYRGRWAGVLEYPGVLPLASRGKAPDDLDDAPGRAVRRVRAASGELGDA